MYYSWKQLPQWTKNWYFILGVSFLLWMLFFDSEDLITQYGLVREIKNLTSKKIYYSEQIEKIKGETEESSSSAYLLEKFAREMFFMKKKTEDLYIVVDE